MLTYLFLLLTGIHAVDGDTLRYEDTRYRLWGIDAPERNEQGYQEAKDHLAGLIEGRMVMCETKDVDRYGRPVVQCFIDNVDVACEMVRSGYARDWPKYSGGYYRECE